MKVKLFASLRDGRFTEREWACPEGTTVHRILQDLNINENDAGIILVNSRHVELDQVLSEGDTLAIFPVVRGG
ncbi:MAG TPA: MoaD/ThiS family protein [Thermodesulfobacteriota bacterium]|nr:MoaD/ThiS family protein [Thermodesulfobacteriota bacterium]